MVLKNTNLGVN